MPRCVCAMHPDVRMARCCCQRFVCHNRQLIVVRRRQRRRRFALERLQNKRFDKKTKETRQHTNIPTARSQGVRFHSSMTSFNAARARPCLCATTYTGTDQTAVQCRRSQLMCAPFQAQVAEHSFISKAREFSNVCAQRDQLAQARLSKRAHRGTRTKPC